MRKLILGLVLGLVLIGFFSFVFAEMVRDGNGPHEVSINLKEGWNIIAGTVPKDGLLDSSDIKLEDIKALWYYSPILKEYYQIHPVNELDGLPVELGRQLDDDEILTSAMWIYIERAGKMKYSTLEDYPSLDARKLYAGWNFVTITPDMTIDVNSLGSEEEDQGTLSAVKGNCIFEKVYHFEQTIQEWSSNLVNDDFMDEELDNSVAGLGIVIEVSSDCTLGTSGSTTSPPGLPGGGGTLAQDYLILNKVGDFDYRQSDKRGRSIDGIDFDEYTASYYLGNGTYYADVTVRAYNSVGDQEIQWEGVLEAVSELNMELQMIDGVEVYVSDDSVTTWARLSIWQNGKYFVSVSEPKNEGEIFEAYFEKYS